MALPTPVKITIAIVCLGMIAGSVVYLNQPESYSTSQTTEDAYIQADFSAVGPKVAGTINTVLIEENQPVKKGDLLVSLDEKDFIVAVEASKAKVKSAQANVASLEAQLKQQESEILRAKAEIDANKATLELAKTDKTRFSNLAADGSGSLQALQQATAKLTIEQANLTQNLAKLSNTKQQVNVLQASLDNAKAALALAQADLEAKQLALSYTKVYSPIEGIVGRKTARVGEFVTPGKPLAVIVPTSALYITANYRETQLANVKIGQAVDIEVDALPDVSFSGTVESIGPASGVSYSSIAPHNATGNFTKIVQRLPVRISIDTTQANASQLRVGMSVSPTINTENSDMSF
ncbi:HlyD family secretion protein [Alteromonas sp. 14N.309.X.WAT.G.H12]|uniref:HlyD family secretion protein n=1 Tax=Alteromonas sp. 14N.309.X.WAT.G.H12 TaxID=3120824 RepID=UPI002FD67241